MLSLLDKTVRTAKWHGRPLPETIKASVKETLNGDFVLTFTYPITDSGLYRELKEDYLVRSPVPVLGHQLFRIKKIIEGDSSLEATAYHISDDIMTRLVASFKCDQVPCATALSSLAMASKSPLGDFSFTSDIVKNRTYTTDKEQTLYSALLDGKHSIVGTWEGELVRDNLALSVKLARGQDRGVVISTHYNLKKYQRTKESSQIITRIHATSSFKQEGQDKETILNVTVDSPLINSYPFINEVTYTNNTLKTRLELIEWARAKYRLEGIDKPKDAIVIEAFELDGQTVHLGDTVTLKSKLHGIDMRKKAIAYDYDPLSETYRTITFDDKAGSGSSKSTGGLSTLASQLIDGNQRSEDVAIEVALENANRAFEAEFDKRKVVIDDAILQAQSHGEVYADRMKARIDSDISAIDQRMRNHESENNRTIRDILTKSGANTSLANEAKLKAEQAQTGATEALLRAEQAKVDAIQEANRLATTERNQTETKIASAKTQAIAEAGRLVDLAKSLLTGQIATATTSINQTKEDIKLLASRQLVDSLTGRVTSAESTIRQQGEQISQRVKSSDFDQAKQRLSTAESSITQLGNRITTEISQVEGKLPTSLDTVNLMKGTDTEFVMGHGITNTSWNPLEKKAVLNLTQSGVTKDRSGEILPQHNKFYDFIPTNGTTYTQSMMIDTDAPFLSTNGLQWSWYTSRGHQYRPAFIRKIGTNTYQIWSTYTWNLTNERLRAFDLINLHNVLGFRTTGTYLKFYKPKLTVGTLPSDWFPSPDDIVDELRSVRTRVTQTASGVEQVSTQLTEAASKISTAETRIRQLVTDVSSKASQTDFNTIKRTVENHTTSIHQTNQSILLKADKTFVEGVKSMAETALSKATSNGTLISQTKAELKVTSDVVKTKVAQTDFNTLTGRVTNAETTIRTQAGEITKRLTSTQVESAISSKGYQTKAQVDSNITGRGYITNSALTPYATRTVLENKVRETSESFSRTIRRIEGAFTEGENSNLLGLTSLKKGIYGIDGVLRLTDSIHYQSSDYIRIEPNQTYTWQVWGDTNVLTQVTRILFDANKQFISGSYMRPSVRQYHKHTFTSGNATYVAFTFETKGLQAGLRAKLAKESAASDWLPAPADVASISRVVQTAQGLVEEVQGVNGLMTRVSTLAGSWAVRNLTSAGTILNQLNLNKDGSVKIDGKLVQITGTTYIQDGVISSAKIASLDAGKITTGILSAARIGAEAITADKLRVDQAFFNKITANDAYLRQLFAKSAFVTQVQAVTLSANKISGGILSAINGAMKINLSLGNIKFFTNSPSISREVTGYPHQWVSFETGTSNGKPCGVTIIGSNRWNNWNANDGGFVGIRAWNGANDDQIDIVGDKVRLASAPYNNPDGWDIVTLPNRLTIDAHRAADRPSSVLNIGDVRVFRNASNYVSLKDVLQQFNHNFKHLVNITGRGDVILTWDTIK